MGDAQPGTAVTGLLSAAEVLQPASDAVNITDVVHPLVLYAVQLGYLHHLLFGFPLVVTSGKDGQHVAGSLHDVGRAVDFRVRDLKPEDQLTFLINVVAAAPERHCWVFDERAGPDGPHIHVEYHGP